MRVKRGTRTLVTRRVRLTAVCGFSADVTISRSRSRPRLVIDVSFAGNDALTARRAAAIRLRAPR